MHRRHPASQEPTLKDTPTYLVGATDFTRDPRPEIHDPRRYLAAFCAEPSLAGDLLARTDYNHPDGRPRRRGHWALIYSCFAASPHGSMLPFWRELNRDDSALDTCGFRQADGRLWRPSYQTLCLRFAELEEQGADAVQDAAARLIARAREQHPEIGLHLAVDGTEAATHARARHDCDTGTCPDHGRGALSRIDTDLARRVRQRQTEFDDDASQIPPVIVDGYHPDTITGVHPDIARGGVRWHSGRHWWWCADSDAGPRAYTDKNNTITKFWVGALPIQAIDLFTGGMVGVVTRPANLNEHTGFTELLDQVTEIVGRSPLSVGVDKGLYVKSAYLEAARRGILMVGPHRAQPGDPPGAPAPATARWDTYGDPLCNYCGGRTRRIGTVGKARSRPRIYSRCLLPQRPDCDGLQSIECAHEPRRLIAVSRRSKTYRALYRARAQYERGHNLMRRRYNVAASDLRERPRRLGNGPRHLRALAAMLIDWIRICLRYSWIGDGPPQPGEIATFPVPPLKPASPDAARRRSTTRKEPPTGPHRRRRANA